MERKTLILLITATFVTPQLSIAENRLTTSEGISLLAINGASIEKNGKFLSSQNTFSLPNGDNQLLVRYSAEIKKGNEYELEETDPSVVMFDADNKNITISAPRITTERQVEAFNNQLNWIIKQSNNDDIVYKAELLPLNGFRLGINYESVLRDYNHSKQLTFGVNQNPQILNARNQECSEQEILFTMLKQLYQHTSPETRQRLKAHVN